MKNIINRTSSSIYLKLIHIICLHIFLHYTHSSAQCSARCMVKTATD